MATAWVLKFPQIDLPDQPILVHVTQKQGLDLDLLATDGDAAFRGKVRNRNHTKFKTSNYDGSDEQWADILHYILISKQDSAIEDKQRRNLEAACSISGQGPEATLSITLRTRIEDITHRLGSIDLAYSENTDDVDLFGWACQAIDARENLSSQVSEADLQVKSLRETVETLQRELDALVKAKADHEHQMLSKMTLLLNEKKLKIRNQQRVLATANIGAEELERLHLTLDGDQKQTDSKGRKRRGGKTASVPGDAQDSKGYEAMDIDHAVSDASQAGGTETESENDDDDDLDDAVDQTSRATAQQERHAKELSPPPPPRALPFAKKPSKATASEKPSVMQNSKPGDETASEDDEL